MSCGGTGDGNAADEVVKLDACLVLDRLKLIDVL